MLNAMLPSAQDIVPIGQTQPIHQADPTSQAKLRTFGFSAEDLPKALQFAAWRDLMAPIVDLPQPVDPDDGFEAEEVTWDLENRRRVVWSLIRRGWTPSAGSAIRELVVG